ncbi:MAG: hypothetical protein EPO65_10560, partial [Dehalococcoidia bacterium]
MTRSQTFGLTLFAGAFAAVALIAAQWSRPTTADAQTSGTANQVSISLSNRTGSNIHLWIGHQDPASVKAYVTPNNVALWWVDFKAGGKNANNLPYIDDKLRVNAMRVGDVSPFPSLVTRTFTIRGFATNIRVVWDGSDLQLLVDYQDDSGAKLAGGDSGSSPSGSGALGGTTGAADGNQDIAGLSPAELTAALNAAIIAAITGILISGLGAAAAETVTGGGGAAAGASEPLTPSGPADSGLRDPDSGDAVPAWEPGKYGAGTDGREGKPGDVWYDGVWQPASAAASQIQSILERKAQQQTFNEQQLADFRARNQQLDLEAQARQRAADAAAKADREAQQRAISTMEGIRTAALQRGDKDMYERATHLPYGPDGKLDVDLVNKMRNTMVNRITRDEGAPEEPSSHWVTQGFKNTFDEARHNVLIRIGTGILTGGTSEVGYLGQAAYDSMKAAAEKAAQENREFGYSDALRAGAKAVAHERLPVNTVNLILTKGRSATLKEVGGALLGDAMAGHGVVTGMRNLKASAQAYQSGKGTYEIITARPPTGGGVPTGQQPPAGAPRPRNIRELPENSPIEPGSTGISKAAARQQQWVSDVRGVEIRTRPVNSDVLRRIEQGDIPKPSTIKAKTISREDVLLGAPGEHVGRVGYFEPKMPSTTGMSPEQIIDLQKRFIQRRNEFKDLAQDMRTLKGSGDIVVENGVVKHGSGKYITGDHDIYSITMKDGSPAPEWLKQQVRSEE